MVRHHTHVQPMLGFLQALRTALRALRPAQAAQCSTCVHANLQRLA